MRNTKKNVLKSAAKLLHAVSWAGMCELSHGQRKHHAPIIPRASCLIKPEHFLKPSKGHKTGQGGRSKGQQLEDRGSPARGSN